MGMLKLPFLLVAPIISACVAYAAPEESHSIYEAVAGWGDAPEGKAIGPTHGGVVVDDAAGLVYVSTDSERSILVYQKDGKFVRSIAKDLVGIHAMTLRHERGKPVIYAAHLNNNQAPQRICKLDEDGKILMEIPNKNTEEVPGGWGGLTGVAVADDGSIFASMGYGSNMIHKFDAQGKLLKSFGSKGAGEQEFDTPHGLGIDTRYDTPRLLVVDREKRRLLHFDLQGNWIGEHATGLRRPCSVSFSGGVVAVAELEGRVTLLDRKGEVVTTLGDNPDTSQWANYHVAPEAMKAGVFNAPHGLSFDKERNLYIQDWNHHGRITKLIKR